MNSSTHTLVVDAPRDRLFAYLADVENLPRWATGFCRRLTRAADGYRVETPQGIIHFRLEADPETGTIDMYGGPSPDAMAYWPSRVVSLTPTRSAYIFTNFQWPGVDDAAFATQCSLLSREFDNVRHAVESRG
jgi:hypothetical protein